MVAKKILVVDDDVDFLKELQETLSLSGYEIMAVCNGKTVPEMAMLIKPDIVLVDLKMEGMNGFELTDALKRSSVTKNIPVIAMSGHFSVSECKEAMKKYGFKNYLKKPFNPLDLIASIEKAAVDNGDWI